MASSQPVQIPSAWTPLLRWAFILIIAGFLLSTGVSIYEIRLTHARVLLIMQRALASIELVTYLSRDIDQERLLFDAHIVEPERASMERIERELSNAEVRIAATSQAYEPTIGDDIERAEWQKLQAQLAALRPKVERALDLSRQNLDVQARVALKAIEPEYDAVDQQLNVLVRLNHDDADQQVARIGVLQRIAIIILAGLTFGWTAIALFVARWVTLLIKERESQMRVVTTRMEEQNRELDAFAGRVAHDLRGPLTAINLAAFAQETPHNGANAVFRRGVKQMEAIIDDLLTLSRISNQSVSARCQIANVGAFAAEDIRPKIEAVGGTFHVEVESATASCNEGLLRQVLWNLGENAVKYRQAGVQLVVEIRGRITPGTYEFTVSDNGVGMSPWEAQHAFEPFFRGERVRSTPGTGLGLSIVKRIIEASGGSISMESTPGQGTIFKIRLLLAASKAA